MKRRPRIYYSASQRALMWEHWRKGETLHQIARLFDRYHSSVHRILAESGVLLTDERLDLRKQSPTNYRGASLDQHIVLRCVTATCAASWWPASWTSCRGGHL